MRIGIASSFACGVGVWKRLADEGNEIRVWRGTEKDKAPKLLTAQRFVGEGIVPLEDSFHALVRWCREDPNALLLFDSSGLGPLADYARKRGVRVLGGGTFCDRLEGDRPYGRAIAQKAGIKSPPFTEFSSIDECISYARAGKVTKPVYWKTDTYISGDATHKCDDDADLIEYLTWIKTKARSNIKCILEEALDGFALSTARWWNGRAWVGPYEWTLERKAHMAEEIGPSTGAALNAVGFYEDDEPLIARALNWAQLIGEFARAEAPPGLYDINAVVKDGEAYFLEWTPRFGWDSEGTSHLLYPNFSEWLAFVADGTTSAHEPARDEFAYGLRLTVLPAPSEDVERDAKGSSVGMYVSGPLGDLWSEGFVGYELRRREGQIQVASSEGLVGLSTAIGDTGSALAERIYKLAEKIKTPSRLQYRPDIEQAIAKDVKKCYAAGFNDLPSGLGA